VSYLWKSGREPESKMNSLAATERSNKPAVMVLLRALHFRTVHSIAWFSGARLVKALCIAGCCLLWAGCSKSKEPKIFGRPSAPPVTLHCAWQPGYRYHLRFEEAVLTDAEPTPDPSEAGQHRVTFEQECMVTATNVARGRGGNIGLDMEILSLAMERAKGSQVALSFDSEQGGETTDDLGYIPILKKLVGGHLRFLVSPDGKMIRAEGINEWIAQATSDSPARTVAPRMVANTSSPTNSAGDPGAPPDVTNGPGNIIRKAIRSLTTVPPGPVTGRRGNAASSVRNFFSQDHFRQMLEFSFAPSSPVRVGQEWKSRGDTPITGRGRFTFDANAKFEGWQEHGKTNCARIAVHGNLLSQGNSASTAASPTKETLKGTVWIEPNLSFPITTILDKQITLTNQTNIRKTGTNSVTLKTPPKFIRQNVTLTLLDVTPIQDSGNDGTVEEAKSGN